MKDGLEEFLKRIEQKPTNETLIDRFVTLVLEEETFERIFYLKKLIGLLLNSNPYAALKAAALELQEARKENMTREYELAALKDVESCFLKLDKQENVQFIREEINKLNGELSKARSTIPPKREMPLPKPVVRERSRAVELLPQVPQESTVIDRQRRPLDKTQVDQMSATVESSYQRPREKPRAEIEHFSFVEDRDDELVPPMTKTRAGVPLPVSYGEDDEVGGQSLVAPLEDSDSFRESKASYRTSIERELNYFPSHSRSPNDGQPVFDAREGMEEHEVPAILQKQAMHTQASASPRGLEFDPDEEEDTKILPDERMKEALESSAAEAARQEEGDDRLEEPAFDGRDDSSPDLEDLGLYSMAQTFQRESAKIPERTKSQQKVNEALKEERARQAPPAAEIASHPPPSGGSLRMAAKELALDDHPASSRLPSEEPDSFQGRGVAFDGGPPSAASQAAMNTIHSPVAVTFKTSAPEERPQPVEESAAWARNIEPQWQGLKERLRLYSEASAFAQSLRELLGARASDKKVQKGACAIRAFVRSSESHPAGDLEGLTAFLFEELSPEAIQRFFKDTRLEAEAPTLFASHVRGLAEKQQNRRALNVIHCVLVAGLDSSWYLNAYAILGIVWERLGLRPWSWQEAEGGEAFCRRLQRREELQPLALLA